MFSGRDRFYSTCEELKAVDLDDVRKSIHSEDYLELLGWYLHRRFNWGGYHAGRRSILANLTPALDASLLSRENLFSRLEEIYEQSTNRVRIKSTETRFRA